MGNQDFFLLVLYTGENKIRGQTGAEKAVIKEKFEAKQIAQVPEFTAVHPEIWNWSEGVQGPSVPILHISIDAQCALQAWRLGGSSYITGHQVGRNRVSKN